MQWLTKNVEKLINLYYQTYVWLCLCVSLCKILGRKNYYIYMVSIAVHSSPLDQLLVSWDILITTLSKPQKAFLEFQSMFKIWELFLVLLSRSPGDAALHHKPLGVQLSECNRKLYVYERQKGGQTCSIIQSILRFSVYEVFVHVHVFGQIVRDCLIF